MTKSEILGRILDIWNEVPDMTLGEIIDDSTSQYFLRTMPDSALMDCINSKFGHLVPVPEYPENVYYDSKSMGDKHWRNCSNCPKLGDDDIDGIKLCKRHRPKARHKPNMQYDTLYPEGSMIDMMPVLGEGVYELGKSLITGTVIPPASWPIEALTGNCLPIAEPLQMSVEALKNRLEIAQNVNYNFNGSKTAEGIYKATSSFGGSYVTMTRIGDLDDQGNTGTK